MDGVFFLQSLGTKASGTEEQVILKELNEQWPLGIKLTTTWYQQSN